MSFLYLLLTVRWVKEDRAGGRAEREIELGEKDAGEIDGDTGEKHDEHKG